MGKSPDRFLKLDTSPSPPRFNYLSEEPHSLSVAVRTPLFKESSCRGAKSFGGGGLMHEGNMRVAPQDETLGFKMRL